MMIISFGKVAPAAAGTPQPVTADSTIFVNELVFVQIAASTGKTYAGTKTLNRTTLAGALKQFAIPAANGLIDQAKICAEGGNRIRPADYSVDADVSGEGLLVYGIQV